MLASQLITHHYPTVEHDDSIMLALQLMEDYDIIHIGVIDQKKYLGIIGKNELLDADGSMPVSVLSKKNFRRGIREDEHFLAALRLAAQNSLSLVPVVNTDNEWLGAIPYTELLKAASTFNGANETGAVIVLEMERKNYSFGEISRLVETNDAYITNLNTYHDVETEMLVVTLKINKLEVSDIISTFQRYEYVVKYFVGDEHYENELRHNYDNLMSYLKV